MSRAYAPGFSNIALRAPRGDPPLVGRTPSDHNIQGSGPRVSLGLIAFHGGSQQGNRPTRATALPGQPPYQGNRPTSPGARSNPPGALPGSTPPGALPGSTPRDASPVPLTGGRSSARRRPGPPGSRWRNRAPGGASPLPGSSASRARPMLQLVRLRLPVAPARRSPTAPPWRPLGAPPRRKKAGDSRPRLPGLDPPPAPPNRAWRSLAGILPRSRPRRPRPRSTTRVRRTRAAKPSSRASPLPGRPAALQHCQPCADG